MSQGPENNQLAKPELSATGERFVPQSAADHIQVAYEHLHRYLFAQEFCRGLDVLDIASGEGYGSALLAQSARSVVGVDISEEAVGHCKRKYQRENLEFHKGDCSKIPLSKHSVDVVVSFETIEHIHAHDRFLQEVIRVLRPKGILIISSPDKHEYSDRNGYSNPFHVSELYRQDFLKLLKRHFAHSRSFQQRLVAGSYIAADRHEGSPVVYGTYRGNTQGGTFNEGVHEGLYAVAICSNEPIPEIQAGLFENRFESARIWDWYEQSSRVHHELSQLKESFAKQSDTLLRAEQARAELEKRLGEVQQGDSELRVELEHQTETSRSTEQELRVKIAELDREVVARGEWGRTLDTTVAGLREQLNEARAQLEKEARLAKNLQEEQSLSIQKQERFQSELKARSAQLQEKDKALAGMSEEALRQEERIRSLSIEVEQHRKSLAAQEAIQASLRDDIQAQRDIVDDLVASKERLRNDMLLTVRDVQASLNGKQSEVEDLARQMAALVLKNQELDREVVARGEWGMRLDKEIVELQERLQTVGAERESQECAVGAAKTELAAARAHVADCEQRLQAASQQLDEMSGKLAHTEQLLLEARDAEPICLKKELKDRDALLATVRAEASDLAARLSFADRQLVDLQQEKAQSETELRGKLESQFLLLAHSKESFEAELISARNELAASQESLRMSVEEAIAHSKRSAELAQDLSVLRADSAAKEQVLKQAMESKEDELASLQAANSDLQGRLQRLEKNHATAEQQLLAAQQLVQEVLKSGEDRLRWGSSLDAEAKRLRELLSEREHHLGAESARAEEVERRLLQCEAERRQAVEARDLHADKVSRMQAAVSWKLTAPLRFLRRVFIDKTES